MFSHQGSQLHVKYRKLFDAFLARFNDKSELIRDTMLEFASHYLEYHSDQSADISSNNFKASKLSLSNVFVDYLGLRLRDGDEKVREKAVTTVCSIAMARPEVLSAATIDEVFLRMRDRKVPII